MTAGARTGAATTAPIAVAPVCDEPRGRRTPSKKTPSSAGLVAAGKPHERRPPPPPGAGGRVAQRSRHAGGAAFFHIATATLPVLASSEACGRPRWAPRASGQLDRPFQMTSGTPPPPTTTEVAARCGLSRRGTGNRGDTRPRARTGHNGGASPTPLQADDQAARASARKISDWTSVRYSSATPRRPHRGMRCDQQMRPTRRSAPCAPAGGYRAVGREGPREQDQATAATTSSTANIQPEVPRRGEGLSASR